MRRFLKDKVLVFAYFAALRRQSPKLFYFLLFCTGIQLVLTFLKVEATPFGLYGMYSEKAPWPDTLSRLVIYADDKEIDSLRMPARQWDLLQTNMQYYLAIKANGGKDIFQSWTEEKHPSIAAFPLYPFLSSRVFNGPAQLGAFERWFKATLKDRSSSFDSIKAVYHYYQVQKQPVSLRYLYSETAATF